MEETSLERLMIGPLRRIGVPALLATLSFGCSRASEPPSLAPEPHAAPTESPEAVVAPTESTGLPALPFLDPELPLEARVEDLLGRMTLEEKVSQTLYTAPAMERLGIPAYNWWNEALHGVARAGIATVFPQAIGLAATWDTELMLRVATAISDEARAKYHEWIRRDRRGIYEGLTFWSPNINIFRDPRWGRGMETYGEDPFLAGELAVAFVHGMQGDDPFYLKTVATPKHYAVHSGPEPDRHTFNALVDERDLRETYLAAFRTSVVDGGAESVMCAYNAFRGDPACASRELLEQILRREWGFGGYVVSDCWAIMDIYNTHQVVQTAPEAAALAVAAGTDLNCGVTYDSLGAAVRAGLLSEAELDTAVRRLFRARFRLGMFDPPERVPYASIPYSVNDSEAHRALALETARKSMVLLKNAGSLLPLDRNLGTLAVIGPNADEVEVLLGNYNGFPSDPKTPLRGIREKVSSGTRVLYAKGSGLADEFPALEPVPASVLRPGREGAEHGEARVAGREGGVVAAGTEVGGQETTGLRAEYFADPELEGEPFAIRIDAGVDFQWWGDAPIPGLEPGNFSIRWTGTLVPPVSGRYALGGRGLGEFQVFVNDSLVAEFSSEHEINTGWTDFELTAGDPQRLRVEFRPRREDAAIQLSWSQPEAGLEAEALRAAEAADVVVMVLGLSPRLEGEEMHVEVPGFAGGDRVDIGLPAAQRRLLEAVVATGKPVVLVLLNGSALAVPWAAEYVPAILEAWYPGQAGGTAIADVLFGDYNPAGRLPVTFYRSADQLPPFSDYAMEGRTYKYFRGDPLFPFGHGLSYTTFAYRNLSLPSSVRAGEDVRVAVEVENAGRVAGEEVVQLYLTDLDASAPVPIRSLQGVQRIFLEPGERQTVSFTLSPRQISLIDAAWERVVEPGVFEVSVGGKQPGFTGWADAASTSVVSGRFEVVGRPLRLER
jgi:beta-glucosidase